MFDHIIRRAETINHPYARVRAALVANPLYVFRRATAASATGSASLHVPIGSIDVGTDVAIRVLSVADEPGFDETSTNVIFEWEAKQHARWFPAMKASLELYPASATETRLRFEGEYRPPLGRAGDVVDAVAGHRIAEASVARFLDEVAGWLREELATPTANAAAPHAAGKPAPLPHVYRVTLEDRLLSAPPRAAIAAGPPPQFGGSAYAWSPEELLVGAALECLWTTFDAYARRDQLEVTGWRGTGTGVLDKGAGGPSFTSITLAVEMSVPAADVERARRVLATAEEHCIIARALRVGVTVEADIRPRSLPAGP